MKVLIAAGAGTSVELGVPAMTGLATEFSTHCEQWTVDPELVRRLMTDNNDVEILIESLDKIADAHESIARFGEIPPLENIQTVRSEVEWFVQHAAEKVSATDAHLMWGAILRSSTRHQLTFVTTNYDRAIEIAANAEGIRLDDGFEPFAGGEAASWNGFTKSPELPPIIKLHGSTDWYSDVATGEPRKLRHPMPLFGHGTLRLANGTELGSAMVLPSREKLLTRAPYPRMSQAYLNAVDDCDIAIFIGSSFRDAHVRDQALTAARERPVFIVNRSGNNFGIEGTVPIAQQASQFLISTLPAALTSSDPAGWLRDAKPSNDRNLNVVHVLRTATDISEKTVRRCDAIEQLDRESLHLDAMFVTKLLNDQNATVARFALGLAATSPDRASLVAHAQTVPHLVDNAFAEELTLLRQFASV